MTVRARLIAKSAGVVAGSLIARWVFQTVDPRLRVTIHRKEGARIKPGETILTVTGKARSILAAERVALNFLGHLSGIATLTSRFVQRVHGTRAKIMDTRKTLPGLRLLEKYAVRIGGGHNHRMGLSDAVLIKTNHLRVMSRSASRHRHLAVSDAIRQAKRRYPHRPVAVEVCTGKEFVTALIAGPRVMLLDNWPLRAMKRAVSLRNRIQTGPPLIEVSGGVTLAHVRAIAKTGVDRISIGRLTHSASAMDVSLRVL